MEYDISAIIVTFNPDILTLSNLVSIIKNQVDNIIIVDNSSHNIENIKIILEDEMILSLAENHGIAYAQNIGIKHAANLGSRSVIFFDQDSQPEHDILLGLIKAKVEAEKSKINVSVVGPFYCDSRTGSYSSYIKTVGENIIKVSNNDERKEKCKFQKCDFIISSGSLIGLDVLSVVGAMDEKLFIDMVDIEWCYRASNFGYDAIVASNVIMKHSIGSHVIKIMSREYTVNSPVRSYYSLRNMLYLMLLPYVSRIWKKKYLCKMIIFTVGSIFIYPNKIKRIQAVIWSCLDFIRGKYGKCSHKL